MKPMNKQDLRAFKKLMEIHRQACSDITNLKHEVKVLKEKLSIAKDALAYYADPGNNESKVFTHDGIVIVTSNVAKEDGGKIAFKVLTEALDSEN